MISLIKKLFNSDILIEIRNQFKFRPVDIHISKSDKDISVSDDFLWRTDSGYKTKFKFTDILGLFYDFDDTNAEILFYDKDGVFLKKLVINDLNISNEIIIDKNFLNGLSDYGSFNIFHNFNKKNNNLIIANRCYLGYSRKENFYSYVHGNLLSSYRTSNDDKIKTDIIKTSLFSNQEYAIQNDFADFDKSELFFANPTSKIVKFEIEKIKYILKPKSSRIIDILKTNKKIVIKSNCMFLRPIIFNYKNNFFDVYHG